MGFAGDIEDPLASHSFPTTSTELIEAHGDVEIELPDGVVTLGDVLAQLPEWEFQVAEDARLMTYSAFGTAAIGRKGYTDRDSPCVGEGVEQVSF